jgi:hypothetical protein
MRRATLLAVAAVLAAPGCGGGASDDVKSAVRDYLKAFADGDGAKACSLMSRATRSRFVAQMKSITKSTECALGIEALRTQAGSALTDATIEKLKLSDVKIKGQAATLTLSSGRGKTTAKLVKEGGGWKVSGAPGTQ